MDAVRPTAPAAAGDAPDAVAPPPGNPRFPLLDSLRAIAALSILFWHVFLADPEVLSMPVVFRGLATGVTVFFVLSGFLLYRPYVAAHLRGRPGPRIPDYARRRLLRILPAFWLALTVLALYPGLQADFRHDWWIYYGLLQSYFDDARGHGLPQAWSLSVEFTFYAMLPLIALAGGWLGRRLRPRRPVVAEWAVLGAILVARLVYQLHPVHVLLTPLFFIDWFLAGMVLAVASAGIAASDRPPRIVAFAERHPGLVLLGALAAYLVVTTSRGWTLIYPFGIHLVQGLCALLVLVPAVFVGSSPGVVQRLLANRVLAWLGLISYGIFLWHAPIVFKLETTGLGRLPLPGRPVAIAAVTLALTLALATLSYYVVERPLLRLKDRRRGAPEPTTSPSRA
jgi:peptidoglycan/LPS O-acetylase OafA/YrhL